MRKGIENAFSKEEISDGVIDDELQLLPNPDQDSPVSEMEYSPSTTDEASLSQSDSIQNDLAINNPSSEMDYSPSIRDEESPSSPQPDSVQYDSAIDNSSSSDMNDSDSSTDDENSNRKDALERETRLGLQRCYPIIWAGDLFMGRLQMEIALKFIAGDPSVSRAALPSADTPDPTIHIRGKLSFDVLPQAHTRLKMQRKKENCILIALPIDNNCLQAGHMEYKFIHYLRRKRSVGIAEFPVDNTAEPKYRMLIFPPSDFVYENLHKLAPTFADSLYLEASYPHLLCHISVICCCFECEKTKKTFAGQRQLPNNV